jgi:uncharacterized protein (TIGR03067 family)
LRRNTVKHLLSWSVVVCFCAGALARGGDAAKAKEDGKKMEGTWNAVKAELAGKPYPEEALKKWKLKISDGKYTIPDDDGQEAHATIKLDPSKNPAVMDITWRNGHNAGTTFPAIYELKDDTLRICQDLSCNAHPTEFKTQPKTALFLVEWKREKP